VRSDVYSLSYEEYWQGFRALFAETHVIAIGEPLVRAMAGLPQRTGGCGVSTVRVTPRGTTQPCVYWPGAGESLSLLLSVGSRVVETSSFVEARTVPEVCRSCVHLQSCYGGCAGRRRIQHALHQPDFYCPIIRGETQELEVRMAPARELPKGESSCTTIVIARD
jgi:radical SAM protein with 4Fe4S-binding SPASM domain